MAAFDPEEWGLECEQHEQAAAQPDPTGADWTEFGLDDEFLANGTKAEVAGVPSPRNNEGAATLGQYALTPELAW